MITIIEPQCLDISHEKVNGGFLYGLSLAFPGENFILYADLTHINALKNILDHDNTLIPNIKFIPIKFRNTVSLTGMLNYYLLFRKIFNNVISTGTNKIFFLSFDPGMLYLIKKLKNKTRYKKLKFTFVLHGDFENISDEKIKTEIPAYYEISNIDKIRKMKLQELPSRLFQFVKTRFYKYVVNIWKIILEKKITTKGILLWNHSTDFRYIALSPHIIVNTKKYIDPVNLNIYTVVLPTVFVPPFPVPRNAFPKFAIFGYGDSTMLRKVLLELKNKRIKKPYEIRIIGLDNSGLKEFPNIICPSPGKRLNRKEMEEYARDIDVFLILYSKNRYRLSCSNSILESLSYMKPILHFDNDCINYFNKEENPIGIRCNTIEEFACKMEDIIENYQTYIPIFSDYRDNISILRKTHAIENSVEKIKKSFTWEF